MWASLRATECSCSSLVLLFLADRNISGTVLLLWERLVVANIRLRSVQEEAGAGFPAVPHHVFVWEGPCSRRRRAEALHSWCVQGSRATTLVGYTKYELWFKHVVFSKTRAKQEQHGRIIIFLLLHLHLHDLYRMCNSSVLSEHDNIRESIVSAVYWTDWKTAGSAAYKTNRGLPTQAAYYINISTAASQYRVFTVAPSSSWRHFSSRSPVLQRCIYIFRHNLTHLNCSLR